MGKSEVLTAERLNYLGEQLRELSEAIHGIEGLMRPFADGKAELPAYAARGVCLALEGFAIEAQGIGDDLVFGTMHLVDQEKPMPRFALAPGADVAKVPVTFLRFPSLDLDQVAISAAAELGALPPCFVQVDGAAARA